ncbi:MAG TPA: amidase [Propionibacteriaceae bacterium]
MGGRGGWGAGRGDHSEGCSAIAPPAARRGAHMNGAAGTALWRLGATELAEAIRTKQASSREVIEAHLRRIEAVNASINAVVIVLHEQALDAATAADRAVAACADHPPFHGVPFTVKENIDFAGTPTTQGFRTLANAYPSRDAPIVERLKAAGGIPIGRTNLPSGGTARANCGERRSGTGPTGSRDRHRYESVGSGNDGLGSLRHPAQCCGVSALKPTLGRIPHASSIEPADVGTMA